MRSRCRAFVTLACLAVASACASSPTPPETPFDAVKRTLAWRGSGPEYQTFRIEERDSTYVRGFRERASPLVELRELVFHGVFLYGHPKSHGAQRDDEAFLARANDPKPYPENDADAMVELARLVTLRLHGVDDVKWFLHGDFDALVEVRTTASATRFEFRRNHSGEAGAPGAPAWRTLVLDGDGVPRIE